MNGSTGDMTSSAFEKPDRRQAVLTLGLARRMLPLVRQIVSDLVEVQRGLGQLQPEQARLDRQRHVLTWPQRARRYQVQEEVLRHERRLQELALELDGLGVAVLGQDDGRVGFPTIVNERRAFFSWRPGEEGLSRWHYADDSTLRPIPASWEEAPVATAKRKR